MCVCELPAPKKKGRAGIAGASGRKGAVEMSETDKKKSRIIIIVALAQLVAALAIMIYGVLNHSLTNFQSNILMGGSLLIYWILADIAEPFLCHRFDGISQTQKESYVKYLLFDFAGYAGIAYFLLGMGSSQSGSILGAVVYAISIKPKQENQKIFYGEIQPEEAAEDEEPEEEADKDQTKALPEKDTEE